jgi:hypothetical protein
VRAGHHRAPPARAARRAWAAHRARVLPWVLLASAGAGAAVVVAAAGPPRWIAGAVLCLYLPGRLAVLALPGRRLDPVLGLALTIALSLAATMSVGFGAAVARRVEAPAVALGLFGLCAVLAAVAARQPAVEHVSHVDTSPARRPARLLTVGAAIPLVVLLALLAVRVTDAVRSTSPDSHYTELSVEMSGPGQPAAVVRSLEPATTTFSYEQRRDGTVVRTARFTLHPGERTTIDLVGPLSGRVELILYKAGHAGAYRRVIP